jgi:membrane protein insertase Oxa1/YidC/SpoIIIJ
VKRVIACLLFVLLGLAFVGPTVAHARTVSAQSEAQKKTQKYWKKAGKQQAKAQKKQLKAQKKAAKKWNRDHPTRTTTT